MKLATLGESEILITLIALAILLLSAFVCGSLIVIYVGNKSGM